MSKLNDLPKGEAEFPRSLAVLVSATAAGSSKLARTSSARKPTSRYLNATVGVVPTANPRMKTVSVVLPPDVNSGEPLSTKFPNERSTASKRRDSSISRKQLVQHGVRRRNSIPPS